MSGTNASPLLSLPYVIGYETLPREISSLKIPSPMLTLPFLITQRIFRNCNDRTQCTHNSVHLSI